MTSGVISAFTLLVALLLEYTFVSALPSPWREIALPLIFGIVIMYRVSLFLGGLFLLTAAFLSFSRGLAGGDLVLAYVVAALSAVLLSSRVFARRSLIALAGFALGTTTIFYLTKVLYSALSDVALGQAVGGVPVLHTLFALFSTVMGVIAASLVFTNLRENFGRRFMRKDFSYEIQSRS